MGKKSMKHFVKSITRSVYHRAATLTVVRVGTERGEQSRETKLASSGLAEKIAEATLTLTFMCVCVSGGQVIED